MTEGKYITGVVIANNVPDSEGDCLDKKDIKKIFSKYLDRNTDVMHTRIKNEGVEVLANWITESDTELGGKIVPTGSWMVTFIITNESILASIEDGSIGGISLGSVSEDAMTKKYWFINKAINYNDLDDMEEVIPLFISFVDKPANQYGLEIMDYNVYINKNNKNGEKMTNEEKKEEEAMIPVSAIGKLKDIFSINKAESGEKKDEEKIDKEENVEETSDISNKDLLEQLPKLVAESVKQAIVEVISAKEDEKPEKETEKKEDEKKEDDDTKIDKKDNNEKSDDVSINKRQTSMTDNVTNTEPTTSFYERTSRDHLGRKIR